MPKIKIASKTNTVRVDRANTKPKDVFTKHLPEDNICQAAVRCQTKKEARNILDKEPTANIYIRTYKDKNSTREGIYKQCKKTKYDGSIYCWKHLDTKKSNKHPLIDFKTDIISQLGKTVRRATQMDSYLKIGSVSSRKIQEEKVVSTQPVFSVPADTKMLNDLKRIHKQLTEILDRGSVSLSDDDNFETLKKSSYATSEEEDNDTDDDADDADAADDADHADDADDADDADHADDADDADADSDKDSIASEKTEGSVLVDIIYSSDGNKYMYDEINNRIIELDGTIVGDIYEIDDERAPFTINDKRYIVPKNIKIKGKPHMCCMVTNNIYDMTHKYIGEMLINDGIKRIKRA